MPPKTDTDKTPQAMTDDVSIEGVILGKKEMLESELTQYVVKLENSPMFSKVSVVKKNMISLNKNEVINFALSAKTGKQ